MQRQFGELEIFRVKALLYVRSWELNAQRRQRETEEHFMLSGDQHYIVDLDPTLLWAVFPNLSDFEPKQLRSLHD